MPALISITLLLLLFHAQRQTFLLPTQLHSNDSFNLSQDLLIGDGFPTFIIVDHLRLLIDFSGQIFLRQVLGLPALLDEPSHVQSDAVMMQFFRLPVQLRRVQGRRSLLVRCRVELFRGFDGNALPLCCIDDLLGPQLTGLHRLLAEVGDGVPVSFRHGGVSGIYRCRGEGN
uniref:Putative secreted protein n=1 Tax=Ixodes ricinus TaxID=34613 RepID=A0A6B0UYB5_IXORI